MTSTKKVTAFTYADQINQSLCIARFQAFLYLVIMLVIKFRKYRRKNKQEEMHIRFYSKLYIPSTLNTDYILWHTQLTVCPVKYYIMGYSFHFWSFLGEKKKLINLKIQD